MFNVVLSSLLQNAPDNSLYHLHALRVIKSPEGSSIPQRSLWGVNVPFDKCYPGPGTTLQMNSGQHASHVPGTSQLPSMDFH